MEATAQDGGCGNGAAVFLDFSTSTVDPKVHLQEAGQTTLVANKNTYVWNTVGGTEPF